jgi:UDPglucose 6-dehydrogenase
LWHLGCVTAASLASLGFTVVALDFDEGRVADLQLGRPPIAEPGLAELIQEGLASGKLSFTTDAQGACVDSDIVWVTFDTPVDDEDRADVDWLSGQLARLRDAVAPHSLVVVSSQVPVGYTRDLAWRWHQHEPTLQFACSPENLRLGQAVSVFRSPDRLVIGLADDSARQRVEELFCWVTAPIVWMSLESAEMTKHALNAFLATTVAYTNEVARLCESVGADAAEVERGLRTDPRIGPRAYVSPGAPIGGGTLARDVTYLMELAGRTGVGAPVLNGVLESNRLHARWAYDRIRESVKGVSAPRVALLGLTYKPGTDTLRRSPAVELASLLQRDGIAVQAFDPVVRSLPPDLEWIVLRASPDEALADTDVAVLCTPWPQFQSLSGDQVVSLMRHPQLVDQTGFWSELASDGRLRYARVGRPARPLATIPV